MLRYPKESGPPGSTSCPVVGAVFKTVGRRPSASSVGSTPMCSRPYRGRPTVWGVADTYAVAWYLAQTTLAFDPTPQYLHAGVRPQCPMQAAPAACARPATESQPHAHPATAVAPYAAVKIGRRPTARATDLASSVGASRRDMTIYHATAVAGPRHTAIAGSTLSAVAGPLHPMSPRAQTYLATTVSRAAGHSPTRPSTRPRRDRPGSGAAAPPAPPGRRACAAARRRAPRAHRGCWPPSSGWRGA